MIGEGIDGVASELVETIYDEPLLFDPGTNWTPTTPQYHLLARIAENVTEQPFAEYLESEFFEPLGMDSTLLVTGDQDVPNLANYYTDAETPATEVNLAAMGSSWGLLSTASDVFKFQRALHTGQLVNPETYEESWERAIQLDPTARAGYGVPRFVFEGDDVITWSANIGGFPAMINYLPEHDHVSIGLSNSEDLPWPNATWYQVLCESNCAAGLFSSAPTCQESLRWYPLPQRHRGWRRDGHDDR